MGSCCGKTATSEADVASPQSGCDEYFFDDDGSGNVVLTPLPRTQQGQLQGPSSHFEQMPHTPSLDEGTGTQSHSAHAHASAHPAGFPRQVPPPARLPPVEIDSTHLASDAFADDDDVSTSEDGLEGAAMPSMTPTAFHKPLADADDRSCDSTFKRATGQFSLSSAQFSQHGIDLELGCEADQEAIMAQLGADAHGGPGGDKLDASFDCRRNSLDMYLEYFLPPPVPYMYFRSLEPRDSSGSSSSMQPNPQSPSPRASGRQSEGRPIFSFAPVPGVGEGAHQSAALPDTYREFKARRVVHAELPMDCAFE